jgi:hypothetical protein
MKEVPFRFVDGRHVDSVTRATSILDDNGNFVTGGQKVLDLRLLEPSYQNMVQAGLTIKTSFDLKPGKHMVRHVVRDSENSQMAARNGTAVIRIRQVSRNRCNLLRSLCHKRKRQKEVVLLPAVQTLRDREYYFA